MDDSTLEIGPAPDLAAALTAGAAERALGGNRPLRLDGTDAVWRVAAGEIEVFAVPQGAPGVGARRTHVATVAAGEMLFGLGAGRRPRLTGAAEAPAVSLVAVGQPGARVHELSAERLKEIARDQLHKGSRSDPRTDTEGSSCDSVTLRTT